MACKTQRPQNWSNNIEPKYSIAYVFFYDRLLHLVIASPHVFINAERDIDLAIPSYLSICLSVRDTPVLRQNC